MKKMKYCKKCVLPDTHETISFDNEGVCNICRQSERKYENIDWDKRNEMLYSLIKEYQEKGIYDCIVPYSGGKDSVFQLWYIVTKLKLKPLVVRFDHWGFRPLIHKNNTKIFKKLGVDVLQFTPNWNVVKQTMLASLKKTGDFCWHCHTGVFAHTMQIAIRYQTPLVFWGESPAEYRAYLTHEDLAELNEKFFNEAINLGIDVDEMYLLLDKKVPKRDLYQYAFPSNEALKSAGIKSVYLGSYINWDTTKNVEIIKNELDWEGQAVEGIPPQYDYEKIECRWQGIRDYCKYVKRGHGRTNHLACIDIRNNRLNREEGLIMVGKYDGRRPASLNQFLELLDITEDEFIEILRKNEVSDWGFDKNSIIDGEPLPDMSLWDKTI